MTAREGGLPYDTKKSLPSGRVSRTSMSARRPPPVEVYLNIVEGTRTKEIESGDG